LEKTVNPWDASCLCHERKTDEEGHLSALDPSRFAAGERRALSDACTLKSKKPLAGLNERWLVSRGLYFPGCDYLRGFGQTLSHEFVNYDDGLYVYENPVVTRG